MKEEWRDVPNYEGYYQASNLGRVKSLDRTITTKNGVLRFYKGKIIKGDIHNGYKRTTLKKGGVGRVLRFSQVVAMAFLGHKPNGYTLVVDHIDGDTNNNNVGNLRIVTHRANISSCFRTDRESFTSTHVGVRWSKRDSVWYAQIRYKGEQVYLGSFKLEADASIAYKNALSKIKDKSFNLNDYNAVFTSRHKGVSFHKATQKWMSYRRVEGQQVYLGLFHTEREAHEARVNAEIEGLSE